METNSPVGTHDHIPVVTRQVVSTIDGDGVGRWIAGQYAAGSLSGGEMDLGIEDGAVAYATTGGHLDPIIEDLQALAARVADGSIVVPQEPEPHRAGGAW